MWAFAQLRPPFTNGLNVFGRKKRPSFGLVREVRTSAMVSNLIAMASNRCFPNLAFFSLGALQVTVFVSIAMASSTQLALPVPERNSMLAAMAFLTPVKDIFQFLEDAERTIELFNDFCFGADCYQAVAITQG